MRDLYETLGVARGASPDDIRKAYRKLARKHHPDVNPGDTAAEERFKEASAAYEVLGDTDKRKAYDEFGDDALKTGFDPDKAREYARWKQERARTGHPFEREVSEFDLADLFGGFSRKSRRSAAGVDVHATVELDFATALRGTEVELAIPIEEICPDCDGVGMSDGAITCNECHGAGTGQVARGPMRMVTTCRACGGRGKTGPQCATCSGSGQRRRSRVTRVRIPSGAANKDTLKIAGKGMPGHGGGPAGDLIIETRVARHPRVTRKGLDLFLAVPVTIDEAYNGASIEVPTFDGKVTVTVPPGSQSGTKLRLRGKGVARGRKSGDFYVELDVKLPPAADPALAEAARAASQLYERPVREELVL